MRPGGNIKVLGVTGKIASGKSTVAGYIGKLKKGTLVVDVDKVAKSIYPKNPEILKKLEEVFGEEVFDDNGNLVFKALAGRVFSSKKELRKLNNLMFPLIRSEIENILNKKRKAEYIIIDAAILFDCRLNEFCDYIILVNNPVKRRKQFLHDNGYSDSEIKLRIEGQHININKNEVDFIIDNSGSRESLLKKVQKTLKDI